VLVPTKLVVVYDPVVMICGVILGVAMTAAQKTSKAKGKVMVVAPVKITVPHLI
jgi:hypothetical protein